MTSTVGY